VPVLSEQRMSTPPVLTIGRGLVIGLALSPRRRAPTAMVTEVRSASPPGSRPRDTSATPACSSTGLWTKERDSDNQCYQRYGEKNQVVADLQHGFLEMAGDRANAPLRRSCRSRCRRWVGVPLLHPSASISPWRMMEPENTASPGFFSAGSDSPVSAGLVHLHRVAGSRRAFGWNDVASLRRMTSPVTLSFAEGSVHFPSRLTLALIANCFRSAAIRHRPPGVLPRIQPRRWTPTGAG